MKQVIFKNLVIHIDEAIISDELFNSLFFPNQIKSNQIKSNQIKSNKVAPDANKVTKNANNVTKNAKIVTKRPNFKHGITAVKKCQKCGKDYSPTSNVQKYCAECSSNIGKEKQKQYRETFKNKKLEVADPQELDSVLQEIEANKKKTYTIGS